ncbi:hypothetical protein [Antarcticirhabdus aurantiaca]|uniref:Uncharacterized protein n=1 Tax=Antarcticirhabdus aurantiaca TaxID=2606717 RepID=A0ACD4NJA0_9HYPH|nr:hypothetical protein OXU80_18525 [Jeongeuplla avenae]
MKLWARIEESRVVETFSHPTDPTPLFVPGWMWVEAPEGTRQGATYDGSTFANPPEPEEPTTPPTPEPARRLLLTPAEFRNSFSAFEEVAIVDFAAGVGAPGGDDAQTKTIRRVVGVFFERLRDPHLQTVDLADPRNLAGLDLLVGAGILSAERRAAIAQGVPA